MLVWDPYLNGLTNHAPFILPPIITEAVLSSVNDGALLIAALLSLSLFLFLSYTYTHTHNYFSSLPADWPLKSIEFMRPGFSIHHEGDWDCKQKHVESNTCAEWHSCSLS